MNLMDRYNELNTVSKYPPDYAEQWAGLAAMFLADGRPSMADTCRRKAAYYSDPTLLCGIGGQKATVVKTSYLQYVRVIEVAQ